jgi:hypothetical protein
MDKDQIDVELEELLNNTSSREVETPGASDENINNSKLVSEDVNTPAVSEDTHRANERIRELVEENKRLKEIEVSRNSNDLDKFVDSIEDEPSRNLLKQYGKLMHETVRKEYAPVLEEFNTVKFDKEFAQFESIPNLAQHKEDLRKSYLRNPSQSLKALVGEILVDTQSSKIKPVERIASQANRSEPSLIDASTDDLYAILESRPPIN